MTAPDPSPRTPTLAGFLETLDRAACREGGTCGSAFPVIDIADVVSPPRLAPPPAGPPYTMTVPVLRSAVHENVMSPQLGGIGPQPEGDPGLAMFAPDKPS